MRNPLRLLLAIIMPLVAAWGSASLRVSLLTFYPGGEIYELDGHTALRISGDSVPDMAYNWGTFDFNTPNFVYRFVKGETDYTLAAAPTDLFIDLYRRSGRRVVEQVLDMNDIQAARLDSLINENMRPENRIYRYNYVLDNCATRPLNLIEKAIGDTLRVDRPIAPGDTTFRAAMTRNHINYPWYQFGIDMALGSGLDRRISQRERCFAPVSLMEYLAAASVRNEVTGTDRPLVKSTSVIVDLPADNALLPPTPFWLTPQFWGWVVFALITFISWRDYIAGRSTRWVDTILFGINALAGFVLTFLIFVSVHEATSPNWLYLWLNPLCLVGAVGPWIKSARKLVFYWQFLNFALIFALAVIDVAGIQCLNPAFWPLMLGAQLRNITDIHSHRCITTINHRH